MFQAPPFLLFLFLTILHSHVIHASPLGEEQRHQTIHRTQHSEPTHDLAGLQEDSMLSQTKQEKDEGVQEREAPQPHPPAAEDEGDELFKDISPKALAAVLLKALNVDEGEQAPSTLGERKSLEEPKSIKDEDGLTERVRSRTRSSEKEGEDREDEKTMEEEDLESVKSLLKELEGFEPPPKREQEPPQELSPESEDLEELRELLGLEEQREEEKRSSPNTQSRLGGDEDGEKLSGVAQDLLLQYLLSGGENGEEQEEDEKETEGGEEEDYLGGDFVGGQRPLFEDEEANVQDKRSKEDDLEEVDPQTIDKLIELSSRLHLPADDVVDIINDVEKRKRRKMKKKKARDDLPGRKDRTRTPSQSWQDPPNSAYYSRRRLEKEQAWNKLPEPYWNKMSKPSWKKMSDPSWNRVSDSSWNKVSNPSWNKVSDYSWNKVSDSNWNKLSNPSWNKVSNPTWKKVSEPTWNKAQQPTWNKAQQPTWNKMFDPVPRRYRTRQDSFPNYIRPRAFQTPPRYYYKPPSPQREDYFDEDKDKQEEMENYIERILLTHPEVFQ
ncbi:neurosecretory protein VGF [Discoglossus pictus]